jgi:hypothetical protein
MVFRHLERGRFRKNDMSRARRAEAEADRKQCITPCEAKSSARPVTDVASPLHAHRIALVGAGLHDAVTVASPPCPVASVTREELQNDVRRVELCWRLAGREVSAAARPDVAAALILWRFDSVQHHFAAGAARAVANASYSR